MPQTKEEILARLVKERRTKIQEMLECERKNLAKLEIVGLRIESMRKIRNYEALLNTDMIPYPLEWKAKLLSKIQGYRDRLNGLRTNACFNWREAKKLYEEVTTFYTQYYDHPHTNFEMSAEILKLYNFMRQKV